MIYFKALELINKSSSEFPTSTPVVEIFVDEIPNPPIVPPVAVISPDIDTSPSAVNSKFDDDICKLPCEPLIKFAGLCVSLPRKEC